MKGLVIKNENGYFSVGTETNEAYICKVKGRLKKDRYDLLVGDRVEIEPINDEEAFIVEIYERHNSLKRPYVANIDQVILVVAVKEPTINELLLDKFLVLIEEAQVTPVLCLNKIDLDEAYGKQLQERYESVGYKVITTSAVQGKGLDELRQLLEGHISCFAGPSGVGKSSLLNAIESSFDFQTGSVSDKIKRGRHTTRHASLYELNPNSYIMDTPGFSAIDFSHIEERELGHYFPEFYEYSDQCKFSPCTHSHEPICGVKDALDKGLINKERYASYRSLLDELKE